MSQIIVKQFENKLSTVFPLISARGAYKIKEWYCLFYLLTSAPYSMSDKDYSTKKYSKIKDFG